MSQSHAANAVGFLRDFDAASLERLKVQYRGDAEQAMFKEMLGPMSPLLEAQLSVTLAALQEYIQVWSEKSPQIRVRATRANIWSALGSILASIGSGSALTLLWTGSTGKAATLSAAVGMLGGLITLADRYLKRDLYGVDGSLIATYRSLSIGAADASAHIRALKPHLLSSDSGDDTEALQSRIEEANRLIGEMQGLLHGLPD